MNATFPSSRSLVYTLLITVAVAAVAGRIFVAERVFEPSIPNPKKWPEERPRPMPMFGSNDISRWATVRALVDEGTYVVGRRDRQSVVVAVVSPLAGRNGIEAAILTQAGYYVRTKKSDSGIITEPGWGSVDKVLHPSKLEFYSSKPPLLATLLAGLYWLLQLVTGWTLAEQPFAVVRTIVFLVNGVPFLVYLILMCRLVERFGRTDWGRYFVLAGACFATLVTPFAITLNNHTIATFSVVFALYPAIKIMERTPSALARGERLNGDPAWYLFSLAGFFAAFTACSELPAAAFAVALFGILVWLVPKRTVLFFVPAAVIPLAAFVLTNYLAVGQLRPAYSEFGGPWYEYEGSHWRKPVEGETRTGIDWARLRETRAEYAFHLLLGHHGLFSLTPVWVLAVWGMLRFSLVDFLRWLRPKTLEQAQSQSARNPPSPIQNLLCGLTLFLTVVVVGFYLFKSDNYGGWTCGLRWLMWLSPFWLLCLIPIADRLGEIRWGRGLAYVLLAVSIFSASYPAWNPWRHPWLYRLLEALGWPGY